MYSISHINATVYPRGYFTSRGKYTPRGELNAYKGALATTVNEFVINEFVKLTVIRATGPRIVKY